MDFVDILIRGLRMLFGGRSRETPSRFDVGQNIVAAIIVVGGLAAVAVVAVIALLG